MEIKDQIPEPERNWAMLCHISTFAGYIMPLGGILGPLILWLSRKDQSEWIDYNGKQALNFQLSILLYMFLTIPLIFIVVGIPIMVFLVFLEIVCVSIASIKSARGEVYRYPISIPFFQ